MVRRYSVEYQVTPATPPVFLLHAADDDAVDVDNALRMFDSLRRHSVQVDLHVYAEGGHGFGMRYAQGLPIADWPSLLAAWLANR
jgi:dipeptidyl aminopeptidase/acylaminoacyl peptidase